MDTVGLISRIMIKQENAGKCKKISAYIGQSGRNRNLLVTKKGNQCYMQISISSSTITLTLKIVVAADPPGSLPLSGLSGPTNPLTWLYKHQRQFLQMRPSHLMESRLGKPNGPQTHIVYSGGSVVASLGPRRHAISTDLARKPISVFI